MLLGFLSPEFENHRADPRDFRYVTGEDRVSATGSGQVSTLCQVAQQAAVSSTHAPNTITDAAPNLQPTQLEWGFIRLAKLKVTLMPLKFYLKNAVHKHKPNFFADRL